MDWETGGDRLRSIPAIGVGRCRVPDDVSKRMAAMSDDTVLEKYGEHRHPYLLGELVRRGIEDRLRKGSSGRKLEENESDDGRHRARRGKRRGSQTGEKLLE